MKAIKFFSPISLLFFISLILLATKVNAYVGPGLGLGLIGVLIGGVIAILLAIGGILWYPLKRMMKKSRTPKSDSDESNQELIEKTNEDENEDSK